MTIHDTAESSAAAAYTVNAIAALVRRNGVHDYTRSAAAGTQAASLCGVAVLWNGAAITLTARDVQVVMVDGAVTFNRGGLAALQSWHRVLADYDSVFDRRAA